MIVPPDFVVVRCEGIFDISRAPLIARELAPTSVHMFSSNNIELMILENNIYYYCVILVCYFK